MNVLEVKNVKKDIGKREIIKGISFNVKEGEVFGFIGPNGAGKTTTIRMLVGLIAPNSGTISIMGHDIQNEREKALSYIGSVVENPELYDYLTGRENLNQIARIRKVHKQDIEEIIEIIGLKDRIDDKVKKYSLGMKQRLGLGIALLSKPKILILDEPTNGLDPTGIIDFRKIIKKVAKETNSAVFISSHILSEIQHLCDSAAFINNGVIQSVENLSVGNNKVNIKNILLTTGDEKRCAEILKDISFVQIIDKRGSIFNLNIEENLVSELIFKLSENKIPIYEICEKHQELEERYLELLKGGIK